MGNKDPSSQLTKKAFIQMVLENQSIDTFEVLSRQEQFFSRKRNESERLKLIQHCTDVLAKTFPFKLIIPIIESLRHGELEIEKLLGTTMPSTFIDHADIYHVELQLRSKLESLQSLKAIMIVKSDHDGGNIIFEKQILSIFDNEHFDVTYAFEDFFESLLDLGLLNHGEIDISEQMPINDNAWRLIQRIVTEELNKV